LSKSDKRGLVDQMTATIFHQSYIDTAPVFIYTNQLLIIMPLCFHLF